MRARARVRARAQWQWQTAEGALNRFAGRSDDALRHNNARTGTLLCAGTRAGWRVPRGPVEGSLQYLTGVIQVAASAPD